MTATSGPGLKEKEVPSLGSVLLEGKCQTSVQDTRATPVSSPSTQARDGTATPALKAQKTSPKATTAESNVMPREKGLTASLPPVILAQIC